MAAAERVHQPWRILECVCAEETAERRLETDVASGAHLAGNRGYELYMEVKARFEFIPFAKTVIDTDRSLEVCVKQALASLA
jgi:hypothetical protein